MMQLNEFSVGPAKLGYQLQGFPTDFDLVVTGCEAASNGNLSVAEEREKVLPAYALLHRVPIWSMRIASASMDGYDDGKDRFAINRPSEGWTYPLWHELPNWLRENCGGKHVLFDLTTLSGSSIFQLHAAAVRAATVRVSYCYTTPKHYPQVEKPDETPPVVTRSIKQPYGYRSFAQEHGPKQLRRHVIVLGFDRHRPNKFIEHYQWPLNEIRVLLGDPAYVNGGVEQARLSLGSVFGEIERAGHVRIINPKLLQAAQSDRSVIDALTDLAIGVDGLDIVPLGPKPTLLGCVLYWHGLNHDQQERTRILYDFPVSRKVRTTGVDVTWLYGNVIRSSFQVLAQTAVK